MKPSDFIHPEDAAALQQISMFFFWPVLLTQIWCLLQQSSLDDRALAAAERGITSIPVPPTISPADSPPAQHPSSAQNVEPSNI